MTCYHSRKAGLGYPVCCKNLDCDAERLKTPIHKCEMVLVGDVWVSNFSLFGNGVYGYPLEHSDDSEFYKVKQIF